jgi:hypothetical protein
MIKLFRLIAICVGVIIIFYLLSLAQYPQTRYIEIKNANTINSYISYGGKPLLAFGPGDEWKLMAYSHRPERYIRWANWQLKNGMNLIRCYPNLVHKEGTIEPFFRNRDGSYDLDNWNDRYFKSISGFFRYLNKRGIIVHLQLWQVVNFKPGKNRWDICFYNPKNNNTAWAKDFKKGKDFFESAEDKSHPAYLHQREWVRRILDATRGCGNVFIDVMNELGNAGIGRMKWAHEIVKEIRSWEKENGEERLVGVDMVSWSEKEFKEYADDYDLLIFNEPRIKNIKRARVKFLKPVVTVRSNDGGNRWENYIFVSKNHIDHTYQVRGRTLNWRAMMNKVQSIGTYWGETIEQTDYMELKEYSNWARILRQFWDSIEDYPYLQPNDSIIKSGPGNNKYALISESEAIFYFEVGPKKHDAIFPPYNTELVLKGWKECKYEIWDPKNGKLSEAVAKIKNDILIISLPSFVDDIAIKVLKKK